MFNKDVLDKHMMNGDAANGNTKNSDRKLGRGIASLLANDLDINFETLTETNKKTNSENFVNSVVEINIEDVEPNPNQPRKYFDDVKLQELSESIKNSGLLQPIILSTKKDNKYVIIAGERRYRACKLAGLKKIKAIILNLQDQEILKNAILENVQREDLNPIEEASGYRQIIDTFNYTHEQLSKEIGKSRAHITNLLRILTLPDEVQSALRNQNITLGHAKVLLSTENPNEYLTTILEKQLSVRELEKLIANGGKFDDENNSLKDQEQEDTTNLTFEMIKQLYNPILGFNKDEKINTENIKNKISNTTDEEWKAIEKNVKIIEQQLQESSGFNIHLLLQKDGSGKLEIQFEDAEDLTEIAKLFS